MFFQKLSSFRTGRKILLKTTAELLQKVQRRQSHVLYLEYIDFCFDEVIKELSYKQNVVISRP